MVQQSKKSWHPEEMVYGHYSDKVRQYLHETKGIALTAVWADIMSFQQNSTSVERLGYPTQKPRVLYLSDLPQFL